MTVYDARPIGLQYNYNQVCDIMQLFPYPTPDKKSEPVLRTISVVEHTHDITPVMKDLIPSADEIKWTEADGQKHSPDVIFKQKMGDCIAAEGCPVPFPSDVIEFGSVSQIMSVSSTLNDTEEEIAHSDGHKTKGCLPLKEKICEVEVNIICSEQPNNKCKIQATYNRFSCPEKESSVASVTVEEENDRYLHIDERSLFSLARKKKTSSRRERTNVKTATNDNIKINYLKDLLCFETSNKFQILSNAQEASVPKIEEEDERYLYIGGKSLFSLALIKKNSRKRKIRNVELTPNENIMINKLLDFLCNKKINSDRMVDVVKFETTDRLQILANNPSKSKRFIKTTEIQTTFEDFQSSIKYKTIQWKKDVHLLVCMRINQIEEQVKQLENDGNREQSTKQDPVIPLQLSPFFLLFVFFNLGHIMKIDKKKHSKKKIPIRPPSSRSFSKKAMEKKIRRLLLLLSNDVESNPGPTQQDNVSLKSMF